MKKLCISVTSAILMAVYCSSGNATGYGNGNGTGVGAQSTGVVSVNILKQTINQERRFQNSRVSDDVCIKNPNPELRWPNGSGARFQHASQHVAVMPYQQPVQKQQSRHKTRCVLPPAPFGKRGNLSAGAPVSNQRVGSQTPSSSLQPTVQMRDPDAAESSDNEIDQSTFQTLASMQIKKPEEKIHDVYYDVPTLCDQYKQNMTMLRIVLVGTCFKIIESKDWALGQLCVVSDAIGGRWEDVCNNSFCIVRKHKRIDNRYAYLCANSDPYDIRMFCELLFSVEDISQITMYDYWNPLINRSPFIVMAQLTNFLLRVPDEVTPIIKEAIDYMWNKIVGEDISYYSLSALEFPAAFEELSRKPLFGRAVYRSLLDRENALSREHQELLELYDEVEKASDKEKAGKRKELYRMLKQHIKKESRFDCNFNKQLYSVTFESNGKPLALKDVLQMVLEASPEKIEACVTYKDRKDPAYKHVVEYKTSGEGRFMLAYLIAGITVFQEDESYIVFSKEIIDEFKSQTNWPYLTPRCGQRYLFREYK